MGSATKLRFPLPHRRQKQQQQQQHHEVQSISAPMTNKAQKLLGTAEINIDATSSPTSPYELSRPWETRSTVSGVSGISVTVSESTATGTLSVAEESGITVGPKTAAKAGWDQESDIIPKGMGLNASSAGRSHNLDTTTDASSLRRRRSSSTIVSYYDKTKLPLSISQQTSNSAMAKGPPNKILDGLSMESPRPAPSPPTSARKKPSRLDLAHLLPSAASSRFARFAQKGNMVLGPDLLTRSPSVMSTSSAAASPLGHDHKGGDRKLRRKLTKESLKSLSSPRPERYGSFSTEPNTEPLRSRASDTGNLHHLYEHYEQTSFRDTIQQDEQPPTPPGRPGGHDFEAGSKAAARKGSRQSAPTSSPLATKIRHHVSPSLSSTGWRPFPAFSPDEDCGTIPENPRVSVTSSNLASPSGEYATSVSSRHTRTSKASKRTESFADFDPNATSVLSLSSDSEDDYPDPPKTGTSIPSVGSRDSSFGPSEHRRPSNSSLSQESVRTQPKSRFRTSLSPQAPFLAIPEHARSTTPTPPKINPRTSSLVPSAAATDSPRPSVASTTTSSARSPSRLSQTSNSTAESAPTHFSRPRKPSNASGPGQAPEIRHVAMLQARTAAPAQKQAQQQQQQPEPIYELYGSQPAQTPPPTKKTQPTPPPRPPRSIMSPPSMEFVVQDQKDPKTERDGPVLTLSGADSAGEERFIAVTKQEEMLLAAMRARRALMRETAPGADVSELDAAGVDPAQRSASKKESISSIKTVRPDTLQPPPLKIRPAHGRTGSKKMPQKLHFPQPPSSRSAAVVSHGKSHEDTEGQEQVLMYLDRTISTINPYDMAEPSPDLSDFVIDFDAEPTSPPPPALADGTAHSRNSSTASAAGRLTHPKAKQHRRQSSFGRPRPDSEFMPLYKPSSPEPPPPMPPYIVPEEDGSSERDAQGFCPAKSRKMRDIIADAFRPVSQSTIREEDEDEDGATEQAAPPSRKKAVRISAVGLQLPEIGQWGDDG